MLPLRDLPEFPYDFHRLRDSYLADEALMMAAIFPEAGLNQTQTALVSQLAAQLIDQARLTPNPVFTDFLQHYHLNSNEGRVLLILAEALLRIPDSASRNELINSLLPQANWQPTDTQQPKMLQWASKALNFARHFIEAENFPDTWHQLVLTMGDGVLRPALTTGIHLLAKQFVMAETLAEALSLRQNPYRYSFDCLGEAAQTHLDAEHYYRAYQNALESLATQQYPQPLLERDSISIKLSALHPRYEAQNWANLQQELLPKLIQLVTFAAEAGLPITFDAEESERLELGLALFAEVATQPQFKHYEGLGLAVQAYQKRAPAVIDWLQELAIKLGHRIAVRLVKGAYWDSEIKRAQQQGLRDYPVFTRKLHTDICYLSCAHKLLKNPQQFWPQFATHNAHTLAWLDAVADDLGADFEVQRLVGMGESVHRVFQQHNNHRHTRLYAPIGEFNTLLPYLVRRLLENGSSQSFVHQLANPQMASHFLAHDPVALLTAQQISAHPKLPKPSQLFLPRLNSSGISGSDFYQLHELREALLPFHQQTWQAGFHQQSREHFVAEPRHSPIDKHRLLGTVRAHSAHDIQPAFRHAEQAFELWRLQPVSERSACLRRMAEQLQHHQAELLYLLMLEAGKTVTDAIAEWREAVDLCHFYAQEAERIQTPQALPAIVGESNYLHLAPRGVFVCISPWNFPLAIFLGQVVAALVTGNTVIAKAASQTPLIAQRTVNLLYEAGIPTSALQLIIGQSHDLGDSLLMSASLAGVVFTGSTASAQHIQQALAQRTGAIIPLIAETGGLNAMIADSSALCEQLVQDVLVSAFNSAGQRCSSLRVLWLQEDIAKTVLKQLEGALATWQIGDGSQLHSDISAVIDASTQAHLQHYCEHLKTKAKWMTTIPLSTDCAKGYFVAPHAFVLNAEDLPAYEVFGPILHIVTWHHDQLTEVIEHINKTGYGLTLGIHSRINAHIDTIKRHARVGNMYINRNQIGAMVGCQPFGGEGLSGTGFKAGGANYLLRFCTERVVTDNLTAIGINTQLLNID